MRFYVAGFLTAPWLVATGQFVCQFALGVLFAYWLEKSKSVLAPVIGHNVSSVTEYALLLGHGHAVGVSANAFASNSYDFSRDA